ncbi:nucleotidyltransferase domain-containing protein [Rugamonas rivuli]|uniref:Nucleotidyltransferase domain-containing protein n=1 Tax=Rugamonas rivuli TaxID=2743358 RepID=A0A843SL88_9BURK|nr:nucleotidyltransferase domain-containing protein [Rugamonas rivuli]MQA23228.1 nucleotidyltransferase domain-containing protein [Rugamonas rivuli]
MDELAPHTYRFGLSETILNSLCELFAQYSEIDSVKIYGSRAAGNYRPQSDIDLAVFAPAMKDRDFSSLWGELDDLPILFRLDVIHWDQVTNPSLKQDAQRHGALLYERSVYSEN